MSEIIYNEPSVLSMVIFLYNLYIFVWIQHNCLPNMISALDPSNYVIKRINNGVHVKI